MFLVSLFFLDAQQCAWNETGAGRDDLSMLTVFEKSCSYSFSFSYFEFPYIKWSFTALRLNLNCSKLNLKL